MTRVVFLLGSGISVPAGMPTVRDITEQVVAGTGVWRHTNGTYVLDGANPNYELYRSPVDELLGVVGELRRRARAADPIPEPTYEDIALLAQQVRDALNQEYESAAILPFAELLGPGRKRCGDVCDYVADMVVAMLHSGDIRKHSHLAAIVEASRSTDGDVALATLNHDVMLEAALEAAGVSYAHGFDETGRWADTWRAAAVPLFKLHGSINWWRVGPDVVRATDTGGLELAEPRPLILSGTFTKILAYEETVLRDQHVRLHECMRDASTLVVVGYGFGDKAINSRVIHWMSRRRTNRLVVCDPLGERLPMRSRPAVARAWGDWLSAGRLHVEASGVGDVSAARLSALL
jgi:hypothetical protein